MDDGILKPLNTLFWFRKGLRLHDNPALKECLQGASTLHCVYFLDPWFACSQSRENSDINKWRFLLESLIDLDKSLRELNSRLFVVRGQPTEALPRLFKQWDIKRIGFEYDSEPYAKQRDEAIRRLAKSSNMEVIVRVSHTLFSPDAFIQHNNGLIPQSYKRFQGLVGLMSIPDNPTPKITTNDMYHCRITVLSKQDEGYKIPSLDELGFTDAQEQSVIWKGGETEALRRLDFHVEKRLHRINNTKSLEKSLLPDQTVLGPYLRFGCLSIRLLFHRLRNEYISLKGELPPLSFFGQLLWREFLYALSTQNPNFDKMNGNPLCMQVEWNHDERLLNLFQRGQTGFPWIDAIIAQLRKEGWIHSILRHTLACFLTWGALWVSWEEGHKIFEDLLLDVDWTLSAGYWTWTSSYPCIQKFANTLCAVEFGKQVDPTGNYVRKYLPALKNLPDQFVYEPWKASVELQKNAGCVIGVDYPERIIDYDEAKRLNVQKLRLLMIKYEQNNGIADNRIKATTGALKTHTNGNLMHKLPGTITTNSLIRLTAFGAVLGSQKRGRAGRETDRKLQKIRSRKRAHSETTVTDYLRQITSSPYYSTANSAVVRDHQANERRTVMKNRFRSNTIDCHEFSGQNGFIKDERKNSSSQYSLTRIPTSVYIPSYNGAMHHPAVYTFTPYK